MQTPIFSLSNLAGSLRQNRIRSTRQKDQTNHSPYLLLAPLIVGVSLLFFSCSDKTELGIEGKILGEDGQAIAGANVAISGPNPDRTTANDNARAEMAKFISVTVDSEIEQVTAEQYGEYHWKLGTVLRSQIIG